MDNRKPRVMLLSESNYLNSGYSKMCRELLKRIHSTNKYDVIELGCIPNPHSKIHMGDGSLRSIALVKEGDLVISHTGKTRKVTKIFKKEFEGTLVKISRDFFRGRNLEVTENHPVLVIKKENSRERRHNKKFNRNPLIEWVPAKDISCGDLVAYANPAEDVDHINHIEHIGFNIELDHRFALVAGWYLAEGCVCNNEKIGSTKISICGSLNEFHIVNTVRNYFSELFAVEGHIYKRESEGVYELIISNREVARFFNTLFGKDSKDKFISNIFWNANPDFINRLFSAYAEGDGCSQQSRNDIVCRTVSYQLGLDFTRLLLKNNIRTSFRKMKGKEGYELTTAGQYASIIAKYFTYKNKNFKALQREETLTLKNLVFSKVEQIHKRNYKGIVYNLEVDTDDSYICDNFVVHNSYGSNHDPRVQSCPWTFIGNLPDPGNQEQEQAYNADNLNQFGKFRFESALLAVKPDHVWCYADVFQIPFLMTSPFREFYYLNFMPTVDSRPQHIDWVAQFAQCDNVLTYTQFAYDLLSQYENINLVGKASPAADYDVYKPLPKEKVRDFYGVDRDALIVGMVCRNQPRKLISDLFECFSKYLATAPLTLSHRTFLYMHTSSPDNGFMLNELLKEFNLSSKVLFTYKCNSCQTHYPAFWQGDRAVCKRCGQYALMMPSTQFFLHDAELAQIYNLMDVYAQFAALGGFEIPTLEAAACGLPTFTIDFSCLEDFKHTIGSFPVKVKGYRREVETHRLYAMPDHDDFIGKLIKFLELPEVIKNKKRFEVQKLARQNYSWDSAARTWMEIFDRTPLRDPRSTWYSQSRYRDPDINIPDGIDNVSFMKWCYIHVLGLPGEIGSYDYQKMLRDLNNGFIFQNKIIPIDRNAVVQSLIQRRQFFNFWEQQRINQIQSEQ